MKKISFILVALFLLFEGSANAQTLVSGGIYQNTTWTLANSPYQVNGSVVVFPGATLTVEPGVQIFINNANSSNLYIETVFVPKIPRLLKMAFLMGTTTLQEDW